MRINLSAGEDNIPQTAPFYKEIAEGNMNNYPQLTAVVHDTQDNIFKTVLASFGSGLIFDHLLEKQTRTAIAREQQITEDKVSKDDIETWIDHPSSRMFLRLESGTHALLDSKVFQKFAGDKSTEELRDISQLDWEILLWKAHMYDRSSVEKELLLNYRIENKTDVWIDTEHPANGYRDRPDMKNVRDLIMEEPAFENKESLLNMSDNDWKEFIRKYHISEKLPIEKDQDLQHIIEFIVHAHAIRSYANAA